ncbi:hypothetical protein ACSBL2_04070 [Pedobacter sp. AW31-3R]|uniref:hypothetical protein n=1 Tax=Pedobacter sp. AW31-3R TaxID=3445781 RepID=UPI003F9F7ACD
MNAELIQEFYLLQQSRANRTYVDVMEEKVYSPIQEANNSVTTWVSRRGKMLMQLETKVERSMRNLKRKFLKF